jgi:putative sugar O-methyltransferase
MKIKKVYRFINRLISVNMKFLCDRKFNLSHLDSGLKDRRDTNPISDHERIVVQRIINSYLYAEVDAPNAPQAYQPGHKWKPQIMEKRKAFIEAAHQNDIDALALLLRNFFRNNGALSILKSNMFHEVSAKNAILRNMYQKELTYAVLTDVKNWKSTFPGESLEKLNLSGVGNPFGCDMDGVIITGSSCSLYYYAQKVNRLIQGIDHPVVAEIGGGFGGLLYYLMGSNAEVHSINFDLPEVLMIAQYYLMMSLPEKRFLLYDEARQKDLLSSSDISTYDFILLPNFSLPRLEDLSVDVFVNTHSLSEMSYPTVEEYIKQISRVTKKYFYHENSEVKREIGYGYKETTSSEFPISPEHFCLEYKTKAIWNEPRYFEFLYQKL